jgi:hypothetical protein
MERRFARFDTDGPPVWDWCDYCGGRICLGEDYYEDGDMRVCTRCARRYAWMGFIERSVKKTARTRGPL